MPSHNSLLTAVRTRTLLITYHTSLPSHTPHGRHPITHTHTPTPTHTHTHTHHNHHAQRSTCMSRRGHLCPGCSPCLISEELQSSRRKGGILKVGDQSESGACLHSYFSSPLTDTY